jgi:hypothetical protein
MVETALGIHGDEILYVGDHIYTDVSQSKVHIRWRTALICRKLEEDICLWRDICMMFCKPAPSFWIISLTLWPVARIIEKYADIYFKSFKNFVVYTRADVWNVTGIHSS